MKYAIFVYNVTPASKSSRKLPSSAWWPKSFSENKREDIIDGSSFIHENSLRLREVCNAIFGCNVEVLLAAANWLCAGLGICHNGK